VTLTTGAQALNRLSMRSWRVQRNMWADMATA